MTVRPAFILLTPALAGRTNKYVFGTTTGIAAVRTRSALAKQLAASVLFGFSDLKRLS
jgi:hypothetical protein